MTPQNIDWRMFLGTEMGLAAEMPFDRAKYAQWRCYWPFGSGMFTDLFVHRMTSMLAATGLRFPGRVTGGGGIYLEYDTRQVPDCATVVADFYEGVQGFISASMCCQETPLNQVIRGHHGSFNFGVGDAFTGYDFVAERPQVTHDSKIVSEHIEVGGVADNHLAHLENFCDAVIAGDPALVKCDPKLGAAAMVIVKLGAESYRQGKVFHFDREKMRVIEGNATWAAGWETMSAERAAPHHIPGWAAGNTGSTLYPQDFQRLAGDWINGVDPASRS
jgi:predicted dehydrogenase